MQMYGVQTVRSLLELPFRILAVIAGIKEILVYYNTSITALMYSLQELRRAWSWQVL